MGWGRLPPCSTWAAPCILRLLLLPHCCCFCKPLALLPRPSSCCLPGLARWRSRRSCEDGQGQGWSGLGATSNSQPAPEFSSGGGLLPVLTLRCPLPVSGPTHPSGKGEHLRSTIEGLGLRVWADGLGRGWDRGRQSHRNSFLEEAQRLPPPRAHTTAFLAPPPLRPQGPPGPGAFVAVQIKASVLHLPPV